MSRKNKKTLKRKHRKTTKKGTKSIRKMKGGGWSFGFGTSCFDNENTINAAVTTNTTVEERKKAIANYIRNNCEKIKIINLLLIMINHIMLEMVFILIQIQMMIIYM